MRMRAYDEVSICVPSVAFTTFANGWTRNLKTIAWLMNVQDCKEI